jgi:hypothetical protein
VTNMLPTPTVLSSSSPTIEPLFAGEIKPVAPARKPVTTANTPPRTPLAAGTRGLTSSPAAKGLSLGEWGGSGEGEKILIYARPGAGKTTLAATAPNAVFLALDDGARKIVHPITRQKVQAVRIGEAFSGFTWADAQSAIQAPDLFPAKCTIIVDTASLVPPLIERELARKKGKTLFRELGWDGFPMLADAMRGFLADLDKHIRAGRNIILLAQETDIDVSNVDGHDYREHVPEFDENKMLHLRSEVLAWCDHVFRIGYDGRDISNLVTRVNPQTQTAKTVGKASGTIGRVIQTALAPTYYAKSRHSFPDGSPLPAEIPFDSPRSRDLWMYLFEGAVPAVVTN